MQLWVPTVFERVHSRSNGTTHVLFVESKCTDESILESNYEMKLSNDDYKAQQPEARLPVCIPGTEQRYQVARKDFQARVEAYQKVMFLRFAILCQIGLVA